MDFYESSVPVFKKKKHVYLGLLLFLKDHIFVGVE